MTKTKGIYFKISYLTHSDNNLITSILFLKSLAANCTNLTFIDPEAFLMVIEKWAHPLVAAYNVKVRWVTIPVILKLYKFIIRSC